MSDDTIADNIVDVVIRFESRVTRAVGYMLAAWLLLGQNKFGVDANWALVSVFGLLGISSSSARIAQAGIAALLFMAIIPLDAIKALISGA